MKLKKIVESCSLPTAYCFGVFIQQFSGET